MNCLQIWEINLILEMVASFVGFLPFCGLSFDFFYGFICFAKGFKFN